MYETRRIMKDSAVTAPPKSRYVWVASQLETGNCQWPLAPEKVGKKITGPPIDFDLHVGVYIGGVFDTPEEAVDSIHEWSNPTFDSVREANDDTLVFVKDEDTWLVQSGSQHWTVKKEPYFYR